MKIVISDIGSYSLSDEAMLLYGKSKGMILLTKPKTLCSGGSHLLFSYFSEEKGENVPFNDWDIERTDPLLIEVVEKLGKKAALPGKSLKIVEIPDDVKYEIEYLPLERDYFAGGEEVFEYGDNEIIVEKHRTWG